MHLERGENNPATREYVIYGLAVTDLDSVAATRAANYDFDDTTAKPRSRYTYFVLAEDFAGNFSLPARITGIAPARGTMLMMR